MAEIPTEVLQEIAGIISSSLKEAREEKVQEEMLVLNASMQEQLVASISKRVADAVSEILTEKKETKVVEDSNKV